MELNIDACRALAIQNGLPLQFVIKEFRVFDVLGQITMNTAPDKTLVFKGGTALNKVYLGDIQRFSEDLDFDSGTENIGETRKKCETIAGKLEGYEIGELRKVRDTFQFDCRYDNKLGGKDNVRVDVVAKKIITSKPVVIRPATSKFTQRFVTGFYVYSLEDLTARKMHALGARAEGKDFYDVYNALPLCGGMAGAIGKMLESEKSRETPEKFLEETVKTVEKANPTKLRNLTNPFIPSNSRPNWMELKNGLLARLEGIKN